MYPCINLKTANLSLFPKIIISFPGTDFPAYSDTGYSDTGYSDTPVTVTVLTVPKWPFIFKKWCG